MMRQTAGELARKAMSDDTKYDALEVGHAMTDNIADQLNESIKNHLDRIVEPEFCVVMVIARDMLIKNLIRRKFYCWPFLPKPRPNQAVFLYSKPDGRITKRLWVLPSDVVMAELAGTNVIVDKRYQTMQAWSVAFFKGTFWNYIRHEHNIDMLSEHEYRLKYADELMQHSVNMHDVSGGEPFDFSKIAIKHIVDTQTAVGD